MANQTVKDAISIKGTDPQHLIEKIIRSRIYDSRYWKEECFGLTGFDYYSILIVKKL
jgi:pre-mRNA-splicing factor 38A